MGIAQKVAEKVEIYNWQQMAETALFVVQLYVDSSRDELAFFTMLRDLKAAGFQTIAFKFNPTKVELTHDYGSVVIDI